MERTVLKFEDFLNEELNLNRFDNGVCRFSERWFYYNPEDDIIYGSDEKPVDENLLFAFNPISCTIILDGKEKQYDINDPVCLIQYNLDDCLVSVYTENTMEVLGKLGFNGTEFLSMSSRNRIQGIFDREEDDKFILIYGDQMVASTFDVIEEN
jgi:hypothetical protein